MAPEKMQKYEQTTKWNILWRRIEEKVNLDILLFICIYTNNCIFILGWIILLFISWKFIWSNTSTYMVMPKRSIGKS